VPHRLSDIQDESNERTQEGSHHRRWVWRAFSGSARSGHFSILHTQRSPRDLPDFWATQLTRLLHGCLLSGIEKYLATSLLNSYKFPNEEFNRRVEIARRLSR
jgi:hypothetical protein